MAANDERAVQASEAVTITAHTALDSEEGGVLASRIAKYVFERSFDVLQCEDRVKDLYIEYNHKISVDDVDRLVGLSGVSTLMSSTLNIPFFTLHERATIFNQIGVGAACAVISADFFIGEHRVQYQIVIDHDNAVYVCHLTPANALVRNTLLCTQVLVERALQGALDCFIFNLRNTDPNV